MAFTERLIEQLVPAGIISTSAGSTAATLTSTVVDMMHARRAMVVIQWGTIPTGGTISAQVYCDSGTSFGTLGTTMTGKAMTTVSATSFSNQMARIEIMSEEVKALGGRYINVVVTNATTPIPRSGAIYTDNQRYAPSGINTASTAVLRQDVG